VARTAALAAATTVTFLGLLACATIMHGTNQDVGISSTPTGATVWIDNTQKARTPFIAKLSRRNNHVIEFQLDGYQPFAATMTHSVSGWVWGNIAFGGLIGFAVDAISGGIYKLTPDQITGTLAAKNAMTEKPKDGIYVEVVLKPQADWIKVAQLQR